MKRFFHRVTPIMVGGLAILVVAACQTPAAGSRSSGSARVVQIDASDFAFSVPDTLPAGRVTLRMTNGGQEPHHAQLLRLNPGIAYEQLADKLRTGGPEHAAGMFSAAGGPGLIDPGRTEQVTLDLTPGTYAMACFVAGADGVPHMDKGMLKQVQVMPPAVPTTVPSVDAELIARDFAFDGPDTLRAGNATYQLWNEGSQLHEMAPLKLAPGTSNEAVQAYFARPQGPPPFEAWRCECARTRRVRVHDAEPGTGRVCRRLPRARSIDGALAPGPRHAQALLCPVRPEHERCKRTTSYS